MRANFIHLESHLRSVLESGIPGDIAEFGVWHGTTFMPMAELARTYQKQIHAVDSFLGMAQATEKDGGHYPKGTLSVGGPEAFKKLVGHYSHVKVHNGFIPDILNGLEDVRFAFVHLDLDQYLPTIHSMQFVWPRLNPGGIMLCHDWFENKEELASAAIKDWIQESGARMSGCQDSRHCWFTKE